MAQYDYITINGEQFPRPVGFAPVREDVYAAEYTTMDGSLRADIVGWRWSDMELKWDCLSESKVMDLIMAGSSFDIVFDDPMSDSWTETVVRRSTVSMRHRYRQRGVTYWRNVSIKVSFVGVH